MDDPDGFAADLEAAIQFGRNVTFGMQATAEGEPEFAMWYQTVRERMAGDPLFEFFNGARLQIVHRTGPGPSMTLWPIIYTEPAQLRWQGMEVYIKPQPRGPAYLHDLYRWWIHRPLYMLRVRGGLRLRAWLERVRPPRPAEEREDFYFDDPAGRGRPCRALVAEYLNRLEAFVAEAEQGFKA